ncbi:alpha-D-ribose 1-methylphosphonate 5-triphosphate diphosphatase [Luteibacter rhizovicinus]|uniref:Alpha-D-ribose 1-methylphosphonate 5-triphosphate diphosphatase n=1 Tax=Luteibacter rhizovicinus TaxID=242606 RepID=A0A4R3YSQ8_9GAMM|nr:alpha-D-ribose 1-methylphosphonate 5-triphosphate diphosphatase [Luteibacter rhizovicinus]TCV96035.1 alpha-D-ribose 1-methylphosphonate 5-triphosphate diphosphatase [Luteibacter rhizovicinus]
MQQTAFRSVTDAKKGPPPWSIVGARVVLRDGVIEGGVDVEGGRIARIHTGRRMHEEAIDFDGDFLLPGLVELHTDNLEKHLMPRAGVTWPALPAFLAHDAQLLAAGITTVLDAISLGDLEQGGGRFDTLRNSLDALDEARTHRLLRCDHYLHLRCELSWPGLPGLLEPLIGRPDLRLLSLMDHTPGQRQYRDVDQYRTYYSRNGLRWNDDEFGQLLEQRRDQQHRYRDRQLADVLRLLSGHPVPLASHDDTEVAHVDDAVAAGASLCEFPTTLEAARHARAAGLGIVAGAGNLVRGGSHAGNVAAFDLAQAHCLDILSSDYMPASLLQGAFILHRQAGWTLPEAIATVSQTPAAALGFTDRGRIASNTRADLLRVHMHGDQPIARSVWVEGIRHF